MSTDRYAFIKANWHSAIVDQALEGFRTAIGDAEIDVFDVPGAFEIPLLARDLAATGRFAAVVGAAFVVDGGIYRHEFVASTVLDGLMRAQMDANVPVLSIVLTPHNFQETDVPVFSAVLTPHLFHEHVEHRKYFHRHFAVKGTEVAEACVKTLAGLQQVEALLAA